MSIELLFIGSVLTSLALGWGLGALFVLNRYPKHWYVAGHHAGWASARDKRDPGWRERELAKYATLACSKPSHNAKIVGV